MQVRTRLSPGGRWIRTSGSAREEIEKSWYPVGVQMILYGFARPRDRLFADSPLEGDRLEPSLPLTRQYLSRAFGVRGGGTSSGILSVASGSLRRPPNSLGLSNELGASAPHHADRHQSGAADCATFATTL